MGFLQTWDVQVHEESKEESKEASIRSDIEKLFEATEQSVAAGEKVTWNDIFLQDPDHPELI